MKPLDIDKILGKPINRAVRIGVELEGFWNKVPQGVELEPDGSVFRDNRNPALARNYGELPLGPMELATMPRFVKKYYPDKVDETCGMHVHMSFRTVMEYDWLMEEAYQDTLLSHLTQWAKNEKFPDKHHIFTRLNGKSAYCQKKFWPDLQVAFKQKDHNQQRPGHRYTVVNYSGFHDTIEVRVLPMMETSEQAVRVIRKVVDITNASLVLLAKKEKKVEGKIELDGMDCFEDWIEERL